MKRIRYISAIFVIWILLFNKCEVHAQYDLTIHNMPMIPQYTYTNPAFMPSCKLHFGFPALSSLYIDVANTGFKYNHLIKRRLSDDSLYIDTTAFFKKLNNVNYLALHLNEELFSCGFKVKDKYYFSFNITEKVMARFTYPKDLLELAWHGNGSANKPQCSPTAPTQ